MSQYSHLSQPDPEWVQIAAKLPPLPDVSPPVEQRRQNITRKVKALNESMDPPYPKSGLQVAETTVPVDGGSITVRTYVPEPKAHENRYPLLVWYHGGGFFIGDLELDDPALRLICVEQRVSCVNVDYRLAPEHPFPIPVNDCYRATQWASENAEALAVDVSQGFIVGGCSAGGNLATVIALKSRDDPLFKTKPTGQILQIPVVCPPSAYPEKWKGELLSMEQNKNAPIANARIMKEAMVIYGVPDHTAFEVAPLLAPSHVGLPAAYLQICGLDPLRDEGYLYEKVLRENHVPTRLDIYPGQPHAFHIFHPQMTQSKKWTKDLLQGVEWLLQETR